MQRGVKNTQLAKQTQKHSVHHGNLDFQHHFETDMENGTVTYFV